MCLFASANHPKTALSSPIDAQAPSSALLPAGDKPAKRDRYRISRLIGRFAVALRDRFSIIWLSRLEARDITSIVCLNPEDELELLSPVYFRWRQDSSTAERYRLIDVPIEDGDIPHGAVVDRFWSAVDEVKRLVTEGERVFIHCTAGRGRTGTFGVAVLLKLGHSLINAGTEMYEVGSYPETTVQEEFLEAAHEAMKQVHPGVLFLDWDNFPG